MIRPFVNVAVAVPLALGLARAATSAPSEAPAVGFQGKGLEVLTPLLGKTWVGEDLGPHGQRTVSVERWEPILGGRAVRLTASVNNGELGYQYTFYVDPLTRALAFQGVSTSGPLVEGRVQAYGGRMVWRERIIGSADLDTVTLTFTGLPGGGLMSNSEYARSGATIPGGHVFRYHVDPKAKLRFR